MNTKLNQSKIASLPQPVVEQLHYLTIQQAVKALFLSSIIGSKYSCVVVLLNNEANALEWRQQKWVRKAWQNQGVTFLIFGEGNVASHFKNGTLFLQYHCTVQKAIYVAEGYALVFPTSAQAKKRFQKLKRLFYREIDLLTSQIRSAENAEGYVTVFSVYTTLYGHYLMYFEWLLLGTIYNSEELQSRLHRLCTYIPDFRKAFVKSTASTYFLLDALASVVKAEQEDLCSLDLEYLPSIVTNAELFHDFAEVLFKQLKAAAKVEQIVSHPKTKPIHEHTAALQLISKHQQVEAIYEYEKRELPSATSGKKEIRYWLIVGEGISNQKLVNWYAAIKQITKETVEVVPIAHSRLWMQKRLFENQFFFQKSMQEEQLIYTREPDLPNLHWQSPYDYYSPDLDFYRSGCLELYDTIQLLRAADTTTVREGLGFLYSSLIARSCQVIIYAKLFYYPNQLPIAILWRLTELADHRIIELRFLLSKLSFNIIEFINYHNSIYKKGRKITPEDLYILDQLVTELINLSTEA